MALDLERYAGACLVMVLVCAAWGVAPAFEVNRTATLGTPVTTPFGSIESASIQNVYGFERVNVEISTMAKYTAMDEVRVLDYNGDVVTAKKFPDSGGDSFVVGWGPAVGVYTVQLIQDDGSVLASTQVSVQRK